MAKLNELKKFNPILRSIGEELQFYEDSIIAGEQYKAGAYLRRKPSESKRNFDNKLSILSVTPYCDSFLQIVNDTVFDAKTVRKLYFRAKNSRMGAPLLEDIPGLKSFLNDADRNGISLDEKMEHINYWASGLGFGYWVLDKPDTITMSPGDDPRVVSRPYITYWTPTLGQKPGVMDWGYTFVNGHPVLSYLKLMESITSEHVRLRVYRLGSVDMPTVVETYVVPIDKWKESAENDETEWPMYAVTRYAGNIPAGLVVGREDPRRHDIGGSDISPFAQFQKTDFNLKGDAYDSILYSKGILKSPTGVKVPGHAGGIARGTAEDLDAMDFISPDVMDIQQIREERMHEADRLEAVTGISVMRSQKAAPQSGESIIQERQRIHKIAKRKARILGNVEEQIFTAFAQLQDYRFAGEVKYDTNYEQRDTQYRIASLKEAQTLVASLSSQPGDSDVAEDTNIVEGRKVVDAIIMEDVIKLISPPKKLTENLGKIGVSEEEFEESGEADKITLPGKMITSPPDRDDPNNLIKDVGQSTFTGQFPFLDRPASTVKPT